MKIKPVIIFVLLCQMSFLTMAQTYSIVIKGGHLIDPKNNIDALNDIAITDGKVAKISVVGVGMRSHAGVAATMFKALADRGINIQAISTSEIKVSVLIDEDETELAVRVLHTAYGLDAE